MKNLIAWILCIIFYSAAVFCQDGIFILKNKINNKEKVICQKNYLELKGKDGKLYKGEFKNLSEDSLLLIADYYGYIKFSIKDISEINVYSKLSNNLANVLTFCGLVCLLSGFGTEFSSGAPNNDIFTGKILLGSGLVLTSYGICLLKCHRHYDISIWEFKMKSSSN